ncbi:MAG: DUF3443 family protein, partial [Candidatus Acidiferrum sp.]
MRRTRLRNFLFVSALCALATTAGCSGSGTGTSITSGGGGTTTANTQTITVNTGPTQNYVDGAFTSVTVCVPGSTTSCQTIDGILVDTGSWGLRIMASALTGVTLPQQNGAGGEPVVECLPFIDGVTWGPVQTADVQIAGEVAKSLPIQVIGSTSFSTVPNGCTSYGVPEDTVDSFGANGVLGIGNFVADCDVACTQAGANNPGLYYVCSGQNCTVTTE